MITPCRPICTSDVAGHYDELDRFYREIWGEHVHHGFWITGSESPREATEQLVEHVASHLELADQRFALLPSLSPLSHHLKPLKNQIVCPLVQSL